MPINLWNITHWAFNSSMLSKRALSLLSWMGFASGPLENRNTHTHTKHFQSTEKLNRFTRHVYKWTKSSTIGSFKGAQFAFCFMFLVETFAPKMLGVENVIRHERLHASQLILSRWQTRWGRSTVTHYNTPAGPAPDRVSVCGFHNYGRSVTNLCHSNYPPRPQWSR